MTIRDACKSADELVGNCEKYVTKAWIKQFKGMMLDMIEVT
jgi:hypothetical protein